MTVQEQLIEQGRRGAPAALRLDPTVQVAGKRRPGRAGAERVAVLAPALLLAACSSAAPSPPLLPAEAHIAPEEPRPRSVRRIDGKKFEPCVSFEPTAGRNEIVYVEKDDLVLMSRDSERRFSLPAVYEAGACRHGPGSGGLRYITADGKKAVLHGITPNHFKNSDLYQPIVEVECFVDLETGTAAPLSEAFGAPSFLKVDLLGKVGLSGVFLAKAPPRAFLWHTSPGGLALEVHDPETRRSSLLKVLSSSPICQVADIDGHVTLACVNQKPLDSSPRHTLDLVRFDSTTWPPRKLSETTIPLRDIESWVEVKPSPDGRRLAYWGRTRPYRVANGHPSDFTESTLAVIDLSSETELFAITRTLEGPISAVELDVQGHGLLVGEAHYYLGLEGRLRYLTMQGKELATFRLPHAPKEIYLLASRDRFVSTASGSCDAGYFAIDLP